MNCLKQQNKTKQGCLKPGQILQYQQVQYADPSPMLNMTTFPRSDKQVPILMFDQNFVLPLTVKIKSYHLIHNLLPTLRTNTQLTTSMESENNVSPKQTLSCRDLLIGQQHFHCYCQPSINGNNITDKLSPA